MEKNQPLSSRLKLFSIEVVVVGALFLVALFMFGILTRGILMNKPFGFDVRVFDAIKPHISAANTRAMTVVSLLASVYVLFPANVLLCVYFLFARHNPYLIKIPSICLAGFLLNELLKVVFNHPRPLDPVFQTARGFSFPSGHAMSAMVFYGMFVYIVWTRVHNIVSRMAIIVALLFLILLIGFSRVYLRVHYASDVLAGFSIGIIFLVIAVWVTGKLDHRFGDAADKIKIK